MNKLNFMQLNIDGFINKEPLLTQLINQYQLDLILLNELKRSNYYDSSAQTIQIPGFITHQRNFRTAILYRKSLSDRCSPFFIPTQHQNNYQLGNQNVHSSSISITDFTTRKTLQIHSVYRPHSTNNDSIIELIEQIQQIPNQAN